MAQIGSQVYDSHLLQPRYGTLSLAPRETSHHQSERHPREYRTPIKCPNWTTDRSAHYIFRKLPANSATKPITAVNEAPTPRLLALPYGASDRVGVCQQRCQGHTRAPPGESTTQLGRALITAPQTTPRTVYMAFALLLDQVLCEFFGYSDTTSDFSGQGPCPSRTCRTDNRGQWQSRTRDRL